MRRSRPNSDMKKTDRPSEKRADDERMRFFLDRMYELSTRAAQALGTDARYSLASSLLSDVLCVGQVAVPMASLESWNVAERGSRKFEYEMPIQFREPRFLDFFLCVLSLRLLIDAGGDYAVTRWEGEDRSTMWAHFLMGVARRKGLLQVDVAGTRGLARELVIKPAAAPRLYDVAISREWMARLRDSHGEVGDFVRSQSRRWRDGINLRTRDGYGECRLSDVRHAISDISLQHHAAPDDMGRLVGRLMADVDAAAGMRNLQEEVRTIFDSDRGDHDTLAFLRQVILQSYICPCPDEMAAMAFIPDVSYHDKERGEISSLALQVFLGERLPAEANEWRMWSSMVSLVGRGKTVHDYSQMEKEEGLEQGRAKATKATIHHLKTKLPNILARLDTLTHDDLAPLAPLVRENLEDVRQRLREETSIVQAFYLTDRGQAVTSALFAASNLAEIFVHWKRRLADDNSETPAFGLIPRVSLSVHPDTPCRTIPERYDAICQEIIVNLTKHADWEAAIKPVIRLADAGKGVALVSEHVSTCRAFDGIAAAMEDAKHRRPRMSGLYTIELLEDLLGLPIWECEVLDKDNRLVRLSYPVALIEEGGTHYE